MALFQAFAGQADPVPMSLQCLDGQGEPVTPDVCTLKIFTGSPLVLVATLATAETLALTGFMVAYLDIHDATLWPPRKCVARWEGTIGGTPFATVDTLEILGSARFAETGSLADSYSTEQSIRNVTEPLEDTTAVPSGLVAFMAAKAEDYLDGRLRIRYTVRFPAPYDPLIVLLNDWKAAALLLDDRQGQTGNINPFAAVLHARVDAILDLILGGDLQLSVPPNPLAGASLQIQVSQDLKNDSRTFGLLRPIRSTRLR